MNVLALFDGISCGQVALERAGIKVDKGILLKHIVHEHVDNSIFTKNFNVNTSGKGMNGVVRSVNNDKSTTVTTNKGEGSKVGYFGKDGQANRVYYIHGKSVTLMGAAGGGAAKMGQYLFGCITPDRVNKRQNGQRFNTGNKFYTLTAQDKHGILVEGYIRKLTPIECCRLQTLPDLYTSVEGVSNSQQYKCIGNGWTVAVIAHVFKGLK